MARYFLHLRDGTDIALDEEGRVYDSQAALREAALANARDIMADDARNGVLDLHLRIEAEDEDGRVVLVLPFRDAIELRHAA